MSTEEDPVRLNGRLAARWARRTVERLRRERNDINALNVFPVPDGDTGSNLYHTVRSAYRAVENLSGSVTLPEVVGAMATGALRGARGNSGLILSVALRGVADALEGVTVLDAPTFAGALELASARARGAVADPVDGTMLTVLESMAAEARRSAEAGDSLIELIEAVRSRSREALRETTGQLDVLFEANIVDAGSTGIVELFDLLYLTVTGRAPTSDRSIARDAAAGAELPTLRGSGHGAGEDALELVFHLAEEKDRTRPVKRLLAKARGSSVVVSWPMVHVHVPDEEHALAVLSGCARYGIADLRVEDLSVTGGRDARTSVIALVSGIGLLFACGLQDAVALDSDSPFVHSRLAEVVADATSPVIVVPDSAAALRTVQETYAETDGVEVVRSRSVAAVLSALAVHDAGEDPRIIFADMSEAASATRVGAVVEAHTGSAGPLMFERGDLLTVIDGRIRAVETDPVEAVVALAERLLGAGGELLTVVTGARLPDTVEEALSTHLAAAHPEVSVETLHSLHPTGYAVLGVE